MLLKVFSLILLATAASAGYLNYNRLSPYRNDNYESYGGYKYDDRFEHDVDLKTYPRYSFNYGVDHAVTGDHKSQSEQRDGDRVSGYYSLREADGTVRNVEYQANDRDGFNAVVSRVGIAHHSNLYNPGYGKYF